MFHGKGEEYNSFSELITTLRETGSNGGSGVLSVAIMGLREGDYDEDFNLILGFLWGLYSLSYLSNESFRTLEEKLVSRDFT